MSARSTVLTCNNSDHSFLAPAPPAALPNEKEFLISWCGDTRHVIVAHAFVWRTRMTHRYDGSDINAPLIASLFGDFTCDEDPSDCNRMRHPPLSGADVGGYGSTGNQLYVHFTTREMANPSVASGSEGWLLTWLHSSGGTDCDLTGDWGDASTPAFASIGTCDVESLRTGETCQFHCEGGLMPSSEADPAVWRTIRSFGTLEMDTRDLLTESI